MHSQTILAGIGNTPLIEIEEGIFTKCEFLNPSGSIKARLAHYMVDRAEAEGILKEGDTIVEATSGNTGNAFSMVAAVKGYKMQVIMPIGYSVERVAISKAFGAEVIHVGDFDVSEALAYSKEKGKEDGFWNPAQFDSEWNVDENEQVLGEEILKQIPEGTKIDAIVQGAGTGGTLIGVAKALKNKHNPDLEVFCMEPDEAKIIQNGEFREHLIEGIADGFVPGIIKRHRDLIDEIIPIKGQDALDVMTELARKGVFVGPSSGANYLAAQKIRQKYPEIKNVLTFFCDEGEKYLQQHFGA